MTTKGSYDYLQKVIKTNLEETKAKGLYDFNVVCDQKQEAEKVTKGYLEQIKEKKGIYDHEVRDVMENTWERVFPFMPERLLAIAAVEKFGAIIYVDPDEDSFNVSFMRFDTPDPKIPKHLKGYPYKLVIDYWLQYPDGEEEYWTSSDRSGFFESEEEALRPYHSFTEGFVRYEEGTRLLKIFSWQIHDPTGEIVADIYIKPVTPIKFIQLNYIIGKSDKDYASLLDGIVET